MALEGECCFPRRCCIKPAVAQSPDVYAQQPWRKRSGYHRRSLPENAMYRFKTLTGACLWARRIDSQATEVAVRVGVLIRMIELARPQSVRIA